MKYLNYFRENNSSDSYREISIDEYNKLFRDDDFGDDEDPDQPNYLSFTKNELDYIKKLVLHSNKNVFYDKTISLYYPPISNEVFTLLNRPDLQLAIRKFNDEWFSVMIMILPSADKLRSGNYQFDDFKYEYYKCDQLDGIGDLLKDKKLTKI